MICISLLEVNSHQNFAWKLCQNWTKKTKLLYCKDWKGKKSIISLCSLSLFLAPISSETVFQPLCRQIWMNVSVFATYYTNPPSALHQASFWRNHVVWLQFFWYFEYWSLFPNQIFHVCNVFDLMFLLSELLKLYLFYSVAPSYPTSQIKCFVLMVLYYNTKHLRCLV